MNHVSVFCAQQIKIRLLTTYAAGLINFVRVALSIWFGCGLPKPGPELCNNMIRLAIKQRYLSVNSPHLIACMAYTK